MPSDQSKRVLTAAPRPSTERRARASAGPKPLPALALSAWLGAAVAGRFACEGRVTTTTAEGWGRVDEGGFAMAGVVAGGKDNGLSSPGLVC